MKITNEQLKQIIKEELEAVLKEGRFNPFHLYSPWAGEIYAAMRGKDSILATREKHGDPKKPERIYRRRGSPVTFTRTWKEEEPITTSYDEVANALRDHGFAANVSGNGGINIKHKGQTLKIYPNINLSLQDALQDAIDKIVKIDPNTSIRSKASRRIGSTINVDDPMMERKRRRK